MTMRATGACLKVIKMPIDIDRSYYNTGTATVSNGGTTVTGQGTLWLQSLRPGDIFGTHAGSGVRIASVDSNTQLTLAYPWEGPSQTAAPYEVQLTPYDSGYQRAVRELLQTMASGNLEALAALDGANDTVPYFTGPGAMALADLSVLAGGGQGWDAIVSTPAGLSNYDDRDPGFRVLVLDAGGGRAAVYERTAESWTDPIYFTGPKGDKGDKGDTGNNGWSPVFAMVSDGERRVLQVTDWTGGNGTKPATGRYLGPSGFVTNIAQAINVRGPAGPGTGDMLSPIYDPNGVAGDAFNMDNMREGLDAKVMTANERQKVSSVVYQPAVEPALDFVMSDPAAFLPEWFSRASGGTYFGADGMIKVAAANEPRIEYDPATGELLGLLIEEQRTNYVRYSQAFDDAAWSKTRVSVTPASIPSPTGVAYHVTDTTENNTHLLIQTLLSWVGNTDYCRWVIAKSDGSGKRLRLYTPSFANWVASGNVIFNLETGTIVSSSLPDGESSGYGMAPLGDGWHLCWIWSKTIAEPTGSHSFHIQLETADGAATYEGDGLSGVYLAAAQVEIGKYPTSYIPTEGAAVTRAADILTVPVSEFPFNRRHGTIFADFRSSRPASAYTGQADERATVWTISDNASGTGNNLLDLYYTNTLGLLGRNGGGSYTSGWIGAQPTPIAFEKVAAAFDGQNARVSRNGASVTGHSVPFGLASAVVMRVGNTGVGISGARVLKGHMRRITYYPSFLSDADLQALTA